MPGARSAANYVHDPTWPKATTKLACGRAPDRSLRWTKCRQRWFHRRFRLPQGDANSVARRPIPYRSGEAGVTRGDGDRPGLRGHVFPRQDPRIFALSSASSPQCFTCPTTPTIRTGPTAPRRICRRSGDQLYFPLLQVPDKFLNQAVAGLTLVSRTAPEPLGG
jgi:hypothetical protein